jgi:ribose-phosphate pyrophosphokinase
VSSDPRTRIHCFPDSEDFGRRLARRARVGMAMVRVHRFPDGESSVRVRGPSGRHAVVVRSLHQPNEKLLEVALAADALRRSGARRVTLVAPYLPYMRQDAVFRSGEAISQRVVCKWLAASFDGLLTLEPHLHRLRDLREFFPGRRADISAAPLFAAWLRAVPEPTLVVGPDVESGRWVRRIAREAGCPFVVGAKTRTGDTAVEVAFDRVPALRRALIVDDIASSGMTIARTARALRRHGVARVEAGVVHAIFAPGAEQRIRAAGVRSLFSCNSIPHRSNRLDAATLFAAPITGRTG